MNFVLIAICLVAGMVLRALNVLPENSHRGINAWLLYVAMPAVALLYIPDIEWSRSLLVPFLMPLLVWAGAWLTVKLSAGWLACGRETETALLLTAGLGNTSFLGFPLTQAYFGDDGLRIAVIFDQVNFLTLSTLGVMAGLSAARGSGFGSRMMLRSIFCFPPFIAFVAALVLPRFVDLGLVRPLLAGLAGTLVPLALFSVGLQIRFADWRHEIKPLSLGLAYKLVVAPALTFAAVLLFQVKGIVGQASVFEAAMAPMVTSAILASEYGLNPRLSNLMVSVGLLLSILTTGLWYLLLRQAL